ncbi:superinfection immunity protein [Gordonia polyisoprenivorans]|uniref:superinfection immunity protein n=1 Tax=Gordonia polyisoprenivorans TaxID=84595 RepID=UPI00036E85FC|nr:superinfection immunity protein [Gordonia polyisoprenivorans]
MKEAVQLLLLIGLCLLPSIIALLRKVPTKGSVIVINVLLGWTIIGWIVALAMAVRDVPQTPRPTHFVVPPQAGQYGPPPQAGQYGPPPQQQTYRRPNPLKYRGN